MNSDRLTYAEVARLYGTRERNVAPMAKQGLIPHQRIEGYVKKDGTSAERYVFSRAICEADLRRTGELAAERRVAS